MLRFALLLALLAFARPANAFWEYGHETIARIAWDAVRPETRVELRRLLARSATLDTPECPAGTIEAASVWPDCIKTLGERFSYAFPWHFQNIDICKPFEIDANCPFGACVSRQITRQAKLLADRKLPVRERLQALAFLVHFVGDLHQPMHAGDHGDQGGNKVPARYGITTRRTNLHAIWDGYLAERAISSPPGDPLRDIPPAERAAAASGTVDDWSRESWRVARDAAYAPLMGDPCAPTPTEPVTLDNEKIEAAIPILRRQVARGGLRLARLLDEALNR